MYTFISYILLFQCQKMGIFRFFTEILPVFSEGRGPKIFWRKKYLKHIFETFLITKNNILDIKNKFYTFYGQFQHIRGNRFISLSLCFFENSKKTKTSQVGDYWFYPILKIKFLHFHTIQALNGEFFNFFGCLQFFPH